MLIEKESNLQDKVVTMKLVSGEEILARCIEHDKKNIKIKQPIVLVVDSPRQKGTNGQTRVTFEPWMLSLGPSQPITLRNDHIVYMAEAGENANREYLKVTDPSAN